MADIHFNPGGSAANCAAVAAGLGTATTFLGFVGTDPFGEQLIEDLKNCGVNVNHVQQNPGKSGVTVAIVNPDGERTFHSYRGVNKTGKLAAPDKDLFENIEILHISGYSFQDKASSENANALIDAAHGRGILVSLDPSYWYAKKYHQENPELLTKIDILLPNLEEARLMAGVDDAKQASAALHALGPKTVVVKLGQDGCLVSENKRVTYVPAVQVDKVVDTTGAGDAFCGGFFQRRAEGVERGGGSPDGQCGGIEGSWGDWGTLECSLLEDSISD